MRLCNICVCSFALLEVDACHNVHECLKTVHHQGQELCQDHPKVQHREHNWEKALSDAKLFEVGQLDGEKDHNPQYIDDQHGNEGVVAQFLQILSELIRVVSSCFRSCLQYSIHHTIPELLLSANKIRLWCVVNCGSSPCNTNLICTCIYRECNKTLI